MSIAELVQAIEEENKCLKEWVEDLKQQLGSAGNTEAYDKLIDLLAPDIEWQEKHMTDRISDRMKDIVAAYRAVRPKEGQHDQG